MAEIKSGKPDSSGFKSRKEQIESIHSLLVKANEIEDKELRTEAIETVWSLLTIVIESDLNRVQTEQS